MECGLASCVDWAYYVQTIYMENKMALQVSTGLGGGSVGRDEDGVGGGPCAV